jgi:hypothetical protein
MTWNITALPYPALDESFEKFFCSEKVELPYLRSSTARVFTSRLHLYQYDDFVDDLLPFH